MTLHLYFARRFLRMFLFVFLVFLGLVYLIEVTEQLRKFGALEDSFARILGLAALRSGETLYLGLPIIMMVTTLAMYMGLARSSELVVTRAAGRSALRALVPPTMVAFLIGVLCVAVFNPIVAATMAEYENRTRALVSGEARVVSISDDGLWLREGNADQQRVIFAEGANNDGTRLTNVEFIAFSTEGDPLRRIRAERAVLDNGAWHLQNVKHWPLAGNANPEIEAERHETYQIPSTLTRDQIRNSFGTPNMISAWKLPDFILRLDHAGFSSRAHRVWLQMELALPVMLVSMMLIGAAFSMRHIRSGRSGVMVLSAAMVGFGLTFIRNFARILGENGQLPVGLSAWAPPVAALLLALALLLHLEDG